MQLLKINKYKKYKNKRKYKMTKIIEVINFVRSNMIPSPMECEHFNSLATMVNIF